MISMHRKIGILLSKVTDYAGIHKQMCQFFVHIRIFLSMSLISRDIDRYILNLFGTLYMNVMCILVIFEESFFSPPSHLIFCILTQYFATLCINMTKFKFLLRLIKNITLDIYAQDPIITGRKVYPTCLISMQIHSNTNLLSLN